MKKFAIALIVICMATSAFAAINAKVAYSGGSLAVGPEITLPSLGGKIDVAVDAAYLYNTAYTGYSAGLALTLPLKGDISAGLLVNYSGYSPASGKSVDLPLIGTLSDNSGVGYGVVVGKSMKLLGRDIAMKVGYDTRLGAIVAGSLPLR